MEGRLVMWGMIWRLDESLINLFQRLVDWTRVSPIRWAQFCCYLGGGSSAWMIVWWAQETSFPTLQILFFAFMALLYATGIPVIERLSHFGGIANPIRISMFSKVARVVLVCVLIWSTGPFIHEFWVTFQWHQLMLFASLYLTGPLAAYFAVCSQPPPRWRHARAPASG
ncbi:hypothetical protein HZC00_04300 [Candidatus Kaiserbacteria bacterium]|nr:hypothetical protein [Candidatus Kaiserbacteria bacterium]